MPIIKVSRKDNCARLECDICPRQWDSTFKDALKDRLLCWECARRLASTPTKNQNNKQRRLEDLVEIWNKLKAFKMLGCGIYELDQELIERYGDWLSPQDRKRYTEIEERRLKRIKK